MNKILYSLSAFLMVVIVSAYSVLMFKSGNEAIATASDLTDKKVIIIDPGHGGLTNTID